jgi:hypothetical protein
MLIGPLCSAARHKDRRLFCQAGLVYLVEKHRLPASAYDDLRSALTDPSHVRKEAPFTIEIVDTMQRVPMPARIVAATVLPFGLPVISRDRRIQFFVIQTIW